MVNATDLGGGLTAATVEVNGSEAGGQDYQPSCVESGGVAPRLSPCPASSSAEFSLDTAAPPFHEGQNQLRACVEDYATIGGTSPNRTCVEREITVDNGANAATGTSLECMGKTPTIVGDDGPNSLVGTSGPDVIASLDGADTVRGLGGKDIICGGQGADVLKGGGGKDMLDSADGEPDRLICGKGQDKARVDERDSDRQCERVDTTTPEPPITNGCGSGVQGTDGSDQLQGGQGGVTITALGGNDGIDAGAGDDCLAGDQGNDTIQGGAGDDFILEVQGNDTIVGGPGIDAIYAGRGDDTVFVKDGQPDVVNCGSGNDVVVADPYEATILGCEGVATKLADARGEIRQVSVLAKKKPGGGGPKPGGGKKPGKGSKPGKGKGGKKKCKTKSCKKKQKKKRKKKEVATASSVLDYDINEKEREYCIPPTPPSGPVMPITQISLIPGGAERANRCRKYSADRDKAEELAAHLFQYREQPLSTRANAFLHSFWVALMVNSDRGNAGEAYHFSLLHEWNDDADLYDYANPKMT